MRILLCTTMVFGLPLAWQGAAAAGNIDYVRQVKPVLAAHCYACHGALQQKGGLRVDTARSVREGGSHGPVIVPGDSGASRLVRHVTASGGAKPMPPPGQGETLSAQEVALVRAWIDQGATGSAGEKPEPDPRQHWAFHTPVRPALPQVHDSGRVRNPIDAFIGAERERRGLSAQPPADRRLLLRRVYLDLIGLPPTREELDAFAADLSPDAYEKVVDRLLASPQYGERWGRHWMDVWRYSDWWGLGAEVRNSQKHIWHWRDWIVESLNRDMGYDEMLREMLAADELYPDDLDRVRATGFLARPYFIFNHNTWMEEVLEHTGKAFLGLTLNCARCHDHKYDPISQRDYYRLRAVFEPYQVRTDEVPGEPDLAEDGIPRVFDCNLGAPTYRFERGDERRPLKGQPLTPAVPALLALGGLKIEPIALPPEAYAPALRPFVLEDQLRAAGREMAAARESLQGAQKQLAEAKASGLEKARLAVAVAQKVLATAEAQPAALQARAAADRARFRQPPAPEAPGLVRRAARAERLAALARAEEGVARAELAVGLHEAMADKKLTRAREGLKTARQALASAGDIYTPIRGSLKTPESNLETEEQRNRPYPTTSTGRRSALARWLTDPRHPLTARVAVNHLWMRHFGKPLVPTVFDFGRKGTPPTHPALLDYLAVELMEHGWSMKHLHRLMVTSETYRLSSSAAGAAPATLAADAENRWYWRMNPVRMEAEAVRDSLLRLGSELDTRQGGPPVPVADESSRRRSLYFVHSHNDENKFLSTFDEANVLECYRRSESIVPQQALALSNSKLALEAAGRINVALHRQLGDVPDARFARSAFETVLAGSPTPGEQAACEAALARWEELLRQRKNPDPVRRARGDLIHALLNHNDFITIR
jgi:hypothetical protein